MIISIGGKGRGLRVGKIFLILISIWENSGVKYLISKVLTVRTALLPGGLGFTETVCPAKSFLPRYSYSGYLQALSAPYGQGVFRG